MNERRVNFRRERTVIAYSDFWLNSAFFLERGEENVEGSYFNFLASLTFSAFTFEAFLNHIGENTIPIWNKIERRLGVNEKLALVLDHLNLEPAMGERPWQVVRQLFRFRNSIAHGKNSEVSIDIEIRADEADERRFDFLEAPWQEYATAENARRVRDDLDQIFQEMHGLANIEGDFLYNHGSQTGVTSLIDEAR